MYRTPVIGDIVIPLGSTRLACGSGRYTHAIVVSVEPLVLVSEKADMLWYATTHNMELMPLCLADAKIVKRCCRRFKSDIKNGLMLGAQP